MCGGAAACRPAAGMGAACAREDGAGCGVGTAAGQGARAQHDTSGEPHGTRTCGCDRGSAARTSKHLHDFILQHAGKDTSTPIDVFSATASLRNVNTRSEKERSGYCRAGRADPYDRRGCCVTYKQISAALRLATYGGLAGVAVIAMAGRAQAAATINFGDDNSESLSIGLGLRASYDDVQDGAPNGKSGSDEFNLDSIRIYINASLNSWIKATLNTERTSDSVNVLDGYARFEPVPAFNVWIGRMLPPSDRSNLDGPYYLSSWLYPGVVSQYPSKFDGRDDGATIWGKLFSNKLVYSAGVFDGHNRVEGASNQSDNLLYAGRLVYNFLDPENNPAYYESSTYYGSADILTLGAAIQYEKDGVGTITRKGDYTAFNIDGLFEKKVLQGGAFTLEGAYYHYNTGGVTDVPTSFNGAGPLDNVGGVTQGNAYLGSVAFLFPEKIGYGKFQPVIRFQDFDATITKVTTKQYDGGLNYIIDGHNARVSAVYAYTQTTNARDGHQFTLGVQVQF